MQDNYHNFVLKNFFSDLSIKKIILIITFIGFIVFSNTLFNNFVGDDKKYIIDYPLIHQIDLPFSFGPNYYNSAGQYRPIPEMYFSILYSLFGNTSFFYHFFQIGLHIIVTVLIFFIFSRFISKTIALFGSLIFLTHPINVESVSYISTTVASPLFVLFGLISFLLLAKKSITTKHYILGFSLFLLSLLTKETGIIFIFLILLSNFLFARKNITKLAFGVIITICIYALLRMLVGQVQLSTRPLVPIAGLSLPERIIHIPLIILYYVKTFFFPLTLAYDQQWIIQSIGFKTFYFPLITDIIFFSLIIIFGIYIFRHREQHFKGYVFFSAWFFVGLFFHLQIFPLDATVAERWFYFPIIGLLGILGIIYQIFTPKKEIFKNMIALFAVAIITILSIRTMIRNTNWQNAITLFTHDIPISDNYDIENSLGIEYTNINDYSKALEHTMRSMNMRPNEFNLHDLGVIYEDLGNQEKAGEYFKMALNAKDYNLYVPHKHDINSYKSYSTILLYYDKNLEAEKFTQQALSDYPNNSNLLMFLSLAKLKQHDNQGALDAASRAYQLDPNRENTFIYQHIYNNQKFSITLDNRVINFY